MRSCILAVLLLAGCGAVAQIAATTAVSVDPATKTLLNPTNLFEANSNRLQRALGITNVPAALLARAFQVESISSLTNLNWQTTPALATNGAALALWRAAAGDRGGGLLRLDPSSTATVDHGITFPATPTGRWIRWRPDGSRTVSMDWWGAAGDGVTDDSAAFIAAASGIQSQGGGDFVAPGPIHLVRAGDSGSVLAYWSNLTAVRVVADSAVFVTDDFGTNSFLTAALTVAGTTASATTPTPHGLAVGNTVIVRDATDSGYDGPYSVTAAPTTTSFSFALSGYSTPTLSATGLVRKAHFYNILFRLKGCTNVNFGSLQFRGVVQPLHSQYRLGWVVVQPRYGSRDVRGHLRCEGVAYGVYSGDYDLATGDCENLDMSVSGDWMGYPVALADSGHHSRFRISARNVHRGAYVGGVHDSRFDVDVHNPDVSGIMITHQPLDGLSLTGCENIDADVNVTADAPVNLLAVGGTRYIGIISGYDIEAPVAHRNIRLRIRGKDAKYTSGLQILGYSADHRLDGLQLSGFVDQRGLGTNEVRHDMYVDQTGAGGMTFRNVSIRDLTFLHPAAGVGAYNSRFHADHMETDLLVDNYTSGMPRNFQLPAGCRVVSVPVFPGFAHDSFEAGMAQRQPGGLVIGGDVVTNLLNASPGTGDLTVAWAGSVPGSGHFGLMAMTTNGPGVAPGSLGLLVTNGALAVRLYGSSLSDWRMASVPGWQAAHAGRIANVGLVRNSSGLRIWTDGHENTISESTSGTAPSWTDSISATRAILGVEVTNLWYVGTVYRCAAWNVDKSTDYPGLAVAWGSGQSSAGDATNTIDASTSNGSFETGGGGSEDPFADWTEGVLGGSEIISSSTASDGTTSLAFVVDAENSYAAAYQTNRMVIGGTYKIQLDARVLSGGAGGAISLVGATDGEAVIQITDSWATYQVTKTWSGTTFLVKRADAAGRTLLVDNIRIRRVGALMDMDFTQAPADLLTGAWPGLAGSSSRMVIRGPGYSGDRGDADVTLRAGADAPVQWFGSPLTGARTVALSSTAARIGDQFRIIRTGAGLGSLSVSGVPLSSNQWIEVMFLGSSWTNVAMGYTRLP